MKLEYKDGFYTLKKGMTIYRGDNRMYLKYKSWDQIKSRPTFFALSKDIAEEEYGVTYEFKADKNYKLLALDHKDTVTTLLSTIPDVKIRKIIELQYGHNKTRNSHLEDDLLITNYLCSMGYDGYATKELNTDFGGKFHPEIMICDPKHIKYPIQVTVDEKKINNIIENYKAKKNAREDKEKRDAAKKKQRSFFFMEDNDEEDTEDFDIGFPKFQKDSNFLYGSIHSPPHTQSQLFHSPVKTQAQLFHSPVKTQSQLFHSPVKTQSQLFHSPPRTNKMLFQYNSPSPNKTKTNKTNKKTPSPRKTPIKKGGKKQNKKTNTKKLRIK